MEITLKYHKGADRKPKPTIYLFREEELPILCPIVHILAIALKDDVILVGDRPQGAEPFFTTNLQDPMKATQIKWKPSKLKVPIFRQAVRTANGLQTSKHKALRYLTYNYYLDRLRWDAGLV
ncbi:hypothetical protein VE00_10676 [Pseudogymnoascus sp. WSF 3629]|nr:hypothetical protein VE00_10676 [Pseudogymnoascus sp. WSF 3629]